MPTTLRHLTDEYIVDLKQTSDDSEITPVQVAFWIITLSNRVLSQHVNKRDSGAFMTTWPRIPVVEPTTTQQVGIVSGRKYIELPSGIFDFDKDAGVEYIAYESDGGPGCPPRFLVVRFERTSPSELIMLAGNPHTKPSPMRPYWYRTKNLIPLVGIENINVPFVEMGLYSTIAPVDEIDFDAPFDFPEELMSVLRREIFGLGQFILQVPSSRLNIGDDPDAGQGGVPTQKIVSVNQPQPEA